MITSDPLRTTGSFVGFYPIVSFIFNHFGSSFSIGKSYPLIDQPCSAFELVLFTLKFVLYVPKMPRWVEPTHSLICVNPKDFTGHTYLVLRQVKLSTTNVIFGERKVIERLYIEEVGVDLELCVHAHGHDVDLIIKASLKLIIPWV